MQDRGDKIIGKITEWDGTGHSQNGMAAWTNSKISTGTRRKTELLNSVAYNCSTKETDLHSDTTEPTLVREKVISSHLVKRLLEKSCEFKFFSPLSDSTGTH